MPSFDRALCTEAVNASEVNVAPDTPSTLAEPAETTCCSSWGRAYWSIEAERPSATSIWAMATLVIRLPSTVTLTCTSPYRNCSLAPVADRLAVAVLAAVVGDVAADPPEDPDDPDEPEDP